MKKILFVLVAFACIAVCSCAPKNVENVEVTENDTIVNVVDTNNVDTFVVDTLK